MHQEYRDCSKTQLNRQGDLSGERNCRVYTERYAINSLDTGREQVWKKTGETNEGVARNKDEGKRAKGGNQTGNNAALYNM